MPLWQEYLATNNRRGLGQGLTIGTFLAYRLRGRMKEYAARYYWDSLKALRKAESLGLVSQGRSVRGGVAYYPVNEH